MPMDAYRHENNLVISFDLPGVDAGAVEVTLENKTLKVVAPRPRPSTEGIQWLTAERAYGTSTWQLPLGDDVDVDALQAHVANGVLTITIPVIEAASRRIEVTTGESAPVESIETPRPRPSRTIQQVRLGPGSVAGADSRPSPTSAPDGPRSVGVVEGGGQVGTDRTRRPAPPPGTPPRRRASPAAGPKRSPSAPWITAPMG